MGNVGRHRRPLKESGDAQVDLVSPTRGSTTRLSKAVAHALRHDPRAYGLELDEAGWTSLDALVAGLRRRSPQWRGLQPADLEELARSGPKRRYDVVDGRIRARYGHSLPGRVVLAPPEEPPDVLFHGTAPERVPRILAEGLLPMRRQYVHLSVDEGSAAAVGRRHSPTPTVLPVAAGDAARGGRVRFWPGGGAVWLAEPVPPRFLALSSGRAAAPAAPTGRSASQSACPPTRRGAAPA